jgi:hypothetical protein
MSSPKFRSSSSSSQLPAEWVVAKWSLIAKPLAVKFKLTMAALVALVWTCTNCLMDYHSVLTNLTIAESAWSLKMNWSKMSCSKVHPVGDAATIAPVNVDTENSIIQSISDTHDIESQNSIPNVLKGWQDN